MYSGTKIVAKAVQKILRGRGNEKAELGDKSKCDSRFGGALIIAVCKSKHKTAFVVVDEELFR